MSTTAEQSLTHHVRLVMDNDDEGIYRMRREIVREALEMDATTARRNVADKLEDLYAALAGLTDDLGVSEPDLPAMEILSTALAFVDWDDIAADYIAEESE